MFNVLWRKISLFFYPGACFLPVLRHRELFRQIWRRNVAQRYRGSMLGFLWSLILPLFMLLLYTFVFSVVFKAKFGDIPNDNKMAFAIIMFSGVVCFNIFAESVTGACGCIVGNPNYVKKVIFPLEILPLAQVCAAFVLSGVSLLLLLLGIAAVGAPFCFSWTMLLLPLTAGPLLLLAGGAAFLVASLAVYIRDLQHVVGILLQIMFFMTPIFYPVSAVPREFRFLLNFNPLSAIIEQSREVLLYGRLPEWGTCGVSWLVCAIVCQAGYLWFVRTKRGFADVI